MRDVVSGHCRILAGDVLAHLAVDRIGRAERSHTHRSDRAVEAPLFTGESTCG